MNTITVNARDVQPGDRYACWLWSRTRLAVVTRVVVRDDAWARDVLGDDAVTLVTDLGSITEYGDVEVTR